MRRFLRSPTPLRAQIPRTYQAAVTWRNDTTNSRFPICFPSSQMIRLLWRKTIISITYYHFNSCFRPISNFFVIQDVFLLQYTPAWSDLEKSLLRTCPQFLTLFFFVLLPGALIRETCMIWHLDPNLLPYNAHRSFREHVCLIRATLPISFWERPHIQNGHTKDLHSPPLSSFEICATLTGTAVHELRCGSQFHFSLTTLPYPAFHRSLCFLQTCSKPIIASPLYWCELIVLWAPVSHSLTNLCKPLPQDDTFTYPPRGFPTSFTQTLWGLVEKSQMIPFPWCLAKHLDLSYSVPPRHILHSVNDFLQ